MGAGSFHGVERHDEAVGRINCASQVVYVTPGILLARLEPRPLLKAYSLGGMMAFVLLVGVHMLELTVWRRTP